MYVKVGPHIYCTIVPYPGHFLFVTHHLQVFICQCVKVDNHSLLIDLGTFSHGGESGEKRSLGNHLPTLFSKRN
jgi:hypothetical protein